jgi:hypothetical protein
VVEGDVRNLLAGYRGLMAEASGGIKPAGTVVDLLRDERSDAFAEYQLQVLPLCAGWFRLRLQPLQPRQSQADHLRGPLPTPRRADALLLQFGGNLPRSWP